MCDVMREVLLVSSGCPFSRCVSGMLYSALDEGVVSQATALKYIGERLRSKAELPDWLSDEDVTRHLLK